MQVSYRSATSASMATNSRQGSLLNPMFQLIIVTIVTCSLRLVGVRLLPSVVDLPLAQQVEQFRHRHRRDTCCIAG